MEVNEEQQNAMDRVDEPEQGHPATNLPALPATGIGRLPAMSNKALLSGLERIRVC